MGFQASSNQDSDPFSSDSEASSIAGTDQELFSDREINVSEYSDEAITSPEFELITEDEN